jgi:hypothetical protein
MLSLVNHRPEGTEDIHLSMEGRHPQNIQEECSHSTGRKKDRKKAQRPVLQVHIVVAGRYTQ